MPYAKTSLRKEKRELREKMRAMGLDYRDIAAEFGRRYRLRPRAAWREAYGWSLQEAADRINEFRGDVGLDPGGFAGMTAPHLCEYENWPGHGPQLSGRLPTCSRCSRRCTAALSPIWLTWPTASISSQLTCSSSTNTASPARTGLRLNHRRRRHPR
jgi:hypothetical protein